MDDLRVRVFGERFDIDRASPVWFEPGLELFIVLPLHRVRSLRILSRPARGGIHRTRICESQNDSVANAQLALKPICVLISRRLAAD